MASEHPTILAESCSDATQIAVSWELVGRVSGLATSSHGSSPAPARLLRPDRGGSTLSLTCGQASSGTRPVSPEGLPSQKETQFRSYCRL
jgi:hypothetical protein